MPARFFLLCPHPSCPRSGFRGGGREGEVPNLSAALYSVQAGRPRLLPSEGGQGGEGVPEED